MDDSTKLLPPDADFFMAALWDAAQPAGIEVPGYTILGEISRGGMGAVHHARQLRPEREVALKVLLPQFAEEPEMLARFQLEARAMAALDHPGILPVYEVGEADGMPFFSMKLAGGGTLADRLRDGPLPPSLAAALMIQLARAVHHAHQHGVLHRDLKPGNFLFMEDGRACVSDFGLAKLTLADHRPLTRTESFFGTPHYMPPEVAAGSVADATVAGDLYSMGAVFYECLTGKRPHASQENVAALLRAIADVPVTPPAAVLTSVPRDLSVICMKALERKPADRYATLEDFAADIERWTQGRPIHARPVGIVEAAWRWSCRHPLPAALVAALIVVSITGSVMLAISHAQRGAALLDARQKLQRSLIDQARSERLLGSPGHRDRARALLHQAADLGPSPEIRDETAAVLARPDLSPAARTLPAPDFPEFQLPEDPVESRKPSAAGNAWLTWHESGIVRLWPTGAASPAAEWRPAEGSSIAGEFLTDGRELVLAETSRGLVMESATNPGNPRILAAPGPMVRYVTPEPAGHRLALARVDGLEVFSPADPSNSWHHGNTPARCAAAWSSDGSRIAVALGDRREVILLAAADGAVCATIPVTGMPRHLALDEGGGLLGVATDDGMVSLCDAATGITWCSLPHAAQGLSFHSGGSRLRALATDGSFHEWQIALPVSFENWHESPRAKADGMVGGIALSPDGRRLLTVSAGCVALWSMDQRRQTGHLLLENQRIDDRASAWWLGDSEILVQIPGGLERVPIGGDGKPGAPVRVQRVPGSTVLDVRPDGQWLVAVLDEEGNRSFELWPGVDPAAATPADPPPPTADGLHAIHRGSGLSAVPGSDGAIILGDASGKPIKLIAPNHAAVAGMMFSSDGSRLIAVTRAHRVFSWNLQSLATD